MNQGMDRGRSGQDRRSTSRISKPADSGTKRVQSTGKPATGRMNAQGTGTSRNEAQQRQGAAPAQDSSKNMMYIGIGGGALVLVLIIALMMNSGEEGSRGGGGGNGDVALNRAISKATEAYQRGEYRTGLDLCEDAMKDPRARKSSRWSAINSLATMCRSAVDLDRNGQVKVAEFRKKIDAAKADQTAMAKANQFWDECLTLLGQYGQTSSGKELRGIKEDLGRWVNTERQGDWQKDYNITKGRIEKSHLAAQNYSEAIREWHRFGEISQDPLLHSRIEQEVRTINQSAVASAEKLVAEAGAGAEARTKLEEGQQKFSGTEGQAVINKAMRGLK